MARLAVGFDSGEHVWQGRVEIRLWQAERYRPIAPRPQQPRRPWQVSGKGTQVAELEFKAEFRACNPCNLDRLDRVPRNAAPRRDAKAVRQDGQNRAVPDYSEQNEKRGNQDQHQNRWPDGRHKSRLGQTGRRGTFRHMIGQKDYSTAGQKQGRAYLKPRPQHPKVRAKRYRRYILNHPHIRSLPRPVPPLGAGRLHFHENANLPNLVNAPYDPSRHRLAIG